MTVADLIRALSDLPPDAKVVEHERGWPGLHAVPAVAVERRTAWRNPGHQWRLDARPAGSTTETQTVALIYFGD